MRMCIICQYPIEDTHEICARCLALSHYERQQLLMELELADAIRQLTKVLEKR